MIKTNKNGFLKAAGLMLALTMLAACVVSGTLAKYYSTGSVNGATVTAAKWSVKVGEGTNNDLAKAEFNPDALNWTIEALASGTENDVVEEGLIAPGTWGYAAITVKNESEVDAVIKVTGSLPVESNEGLTFGITDDMPTDGNFTDKSSSLSSDGVTLDSKNGGGTTEKTIYLVYKWELRTTSEAEQDITVANGDPLAFGTLSITAEQVTPEKN